MSKYTTQVRYICEAVTGHTESAGYNDAENIITEAAPLIFPPFPIFDEAYRLPLETKILRHYYTDEISEETYGLWRLRLSDALNNIMPYYNKLYNSELLAFNPLYTVDYTETHTGNNATDNRTNETFTSNENTSNNDTSSSLENTQTNRAGDDHTSTTTADHVNSITADTQTGSAADYDVFSETPQGALTNVDTGEYLTNARKRTNTNTNTNNGQTSNDATGTESKINDYNETNTGTRSNTENRATSGTRSNTESRNNSSTINGTDSYINHVSGNSGGNYSDLLIKFRETFLNIDMMIINDLKSLFFGLWN